MRTLTLVMSLATLSGGVVALAADDTQTSASQKKSADETGRKKRAEKWTSLFDGKLGDKWKLPKGYDYDDAGKVEVRDANLVLNGGLYATGIRSR